MKYSGSDFKFTSQANHMQKLLQLKRDYEREGFHLQRLYKRRIPDENGIMKSTMGTIVRSSFVDDDNDSTSTERWKKTSNWKKYDEIFHDGGTAFDWGES